MSMIEVKTADLIGPALDWAVCYVEASDLIGQPINHQTLDQIIERFAAPFSPSTDWSQGGPLIEKHMVGVVLERQGLWVTTPINWTAETVQYATTPLIAACRAIVAAKLGDVVQVPADLIGGAV